MTAGSYGQMRATDADRDSVHEVLQAAYADGRLTWEEFDARSTALMQAKTYDELTALTADLYRPAPYTGPPQPPVPYQMRPPTNQMAVISLSFGIGQLLLPFVGGLVAIIAGHKARSEIRRTGESGDGMAVVGLTLGYVGVIVPLLILLMLIGVAAALL
ncbi:MAG TPA: DUF1707 and DUF4190 domain-containing protein [Streptosporangiaceae bacterium]|nr:DUF1707 and DUF4190 domain-containing protein [Streptosporangiaceae bacterium]